MNINQNSLNGTRKKNAIRNMVFGVINKLIILLLPFIIRTIIIYKLSSDYVGLGSLFSSILQVLSVTELGFASAVAFSLYKPIADKDNNTVIEILSFLRTIYKIIGCIILFIGLITLPFLPNMIKGDIPTNMNIYVLYLIYLCNTVISYFCYGFKNTLLSVNQRYDVISKINTIVEITKGLIQILVLLIFKNYYIYIIALPLFTLISNLAVNMVSKKMFPEFSVKLHYSLKYFRTIGKQVSGVAIGRISLVCRNSFDSIIISTTLGLAATTIYSNYYLIFSSITGFLAVILTSISASVGNSLATESSEKNSNDHLKFDYFFQFITSICTICLVCLYQPFMKLWVGNSLMFSNITMVLFCMYFYINNLAQVRSVYSEAAGLWWNFRFLSIIEMVMNLVLNIILGILFGINGILFATIITAFIFSFISCTHITFKKLFMSNEKNYFVYNFIYFICTVVCSIIVYYIISLITIAGIFGFIVKAAVCGLLALILICCFHMCFRFSRRYLVNSLSSVFGKFKKKSN